MAMVDWTGLAAYMYASLQPNLFVMAQHLWSYNHMGLWHYKLDYYYYYYYFIIIIIIKIYEFDTKTVTLRVLWNSVPIYTGTTISGVFSG